MKTVTTYQTDEAGLFMYEDKAQQFALDPKRYNVAFRAVLRQPPATPEGKRARWVSEAAATDPDFLNGSWVVEDIPAPEPAADEAKGDAAGDETINPQ